MQAASYSPLTLLVLGFLNVIFLAFGLFGVFSGFAVGPGAVLVIIFSLTGAQLVYHVKLRRQGIDGPDRL